VLAHRPPFPTSADGPAEVVPHAAVHPLWGRSRRRELSATGAVREVVAVTDLAVRADVGDGPEVVAALQLRVDGATASVDSVLTDPRARRRGFADVLLTSALHRAGVTGCDLVVLEAADLDWRRHWYARRGFSVVGRSWDVVRPGGPRSGDE